jgi:cyclic pyranopterin phosphate synthase
MCSNVQGSGGNARASRYLERSSASKQFRRAPDSIAESGFVFCRNLIGRVPETYMTLHDKFGRQITDLRISVTDRCNFRCVYCRSADPENYREHDEILSWPELYRLARIFKTLGIKKMRVTGGEPTVRPGVEDFISHLRSLEVEDVSMTTNGHHLAERLASVVSAGLHRINISLDSLDPAKFERITRTKSFDSVMLGIQAAQSSPLAPAKVNAVLVRGINDDEVEAFAVFARENGVVMRFIEFMPLDGDRHWTRDAVVPAAEVYQRIHSRWPLEQIAHHHSETARRYRFADGTSGEIGLIAPVTQPFCGHCSRIRLTADGKIRTCLFSKEDHNLRAFLREGASDDDLEIYIRSVVMDKEEGHRINKTDFRPPTRSMVFIGG